MQLRAESGKQLFLIHQNFTGFLLGGGVKCRILRPQSCHLASIHQIVPPYVCISGRQQLPSVCFENKLYDNAKPAVCKE
jgi:hypothetical protein